MNDRSIDIYIPLVVLSDDEAIQMELALQDDVVPMEVSPSGGAGGTYDYQELINKPSINGVELFENYDEIDPTVPDWSKEPTKPNYTADEVGAIDEDNEVPFADLLSAWRGIFG